MGSHRPSAMVLLTPVHGMFPQKIPCIREQTLKLKREDGVEVLLLLFLIKKAF